MANLEIKQSVDLNVSGNGSQVTDKMAKDLAESRKTMLTLVTLAQKFSDNLDAEKALRQQQQAGRDMRAANREMARDSQQFLSSAKTAANTLVSGFSRIHDLSTKIRDVLGKGVKDLVNIASDQLKQTVDRYTQIEMATIGFETFFGKENAQANIRQARQAAVNAPLNATDLIDYISKLAPLSGGNYQLTEDAVLGVAKTIQYSGGEIATEMNRVITNMRDVISKGGATVVDIRQFERAMPAIAQGLKEIGASKFLKNGQLLVDKKNAKDIMKVFADLSNSDTDLGRIFERTLLTTSGAKQKLSETIENMFLDAYADSGAASWLTQILTDAAKSPLVMDLSKGLTSLMEGAVAFAKSIDWAQIAKQVKRSVGDIGKSLSKAFSSLGKNPTEILTRVIQLLTEFIKGFIDGLRITGNIILWLTESFGSFVGVLGMLASPVGIATKSFFGLTTQLLSTNNGSKDLAHSVLNLKNAIGFLGISASIAFGLINNEYQKLQKLINDGEVSRLLGEGTAIFQNGTGFTTEVLNPDGTVNKEATSTRSTAYNNAMQKTKEDIFNAISNGTTVFSEDVANMFKKNIVEYLGNFNLLDLTKDENLNNLLNNGVKISWDKMSEEDVNYLTDYLREYGGLFNSDSLRDIDLLKDTFGEEGIPEQFKNALITKFKEWEENVKNPIIKVDMKGVKTNMDLDQEVQHQLSQDSYNIKINADLDEESKNKITLQALDAMRRAGLTTKDGEIVKREAFGGYINPNSIVYKATGGSVRGVDTVPAMLQRGEFVVKRSAVDKAGVGALNALNIGDVQTAISRMRTNVATDYNYSRAWNNTTNNNQRQIQNNVRIFNRSRGARLNTYFSLANRLSSL